MPTLTASECRKWSREYADVGLTQRADDWLILANSARVDLTLKILAAVILIGIVAIAVALFGCWLHDC